MGKGAGRGAGPDGQFMTLVDEGCPADPAFPQFETFKDKRTACCCLVCTCFFCPDNEVKDEFNRNWSWSPLPCPKRYGTQGKCCCCVCASMTRACWCTHHKKILCKAKDTCSCIDCDDENCDHCLMCQKACLFLCCCDGSCQCNCTKPVLPWIKCTDQVCCFVCMFAFPWCGDDQVRGELGCCGKMCINKESAEPSGTKVQEANQDKYDK
jgi:hypothetical protein